MKTTSNCEKRAESPLLILMMFVGTLASLVCTSPSYASLGGDAATLEVDQAALHARAFHAAPVPSPVAGYTVHETALPSGTVVRQYLSSSGIIFAVTWSGPFIPDLRQLLGPHFDTMTDEQSRHHLAGDHSLALHGTGLVVESGGHPRDFMGRAYLPGLIPKGVNVQAIQ